MSTVKPRRTAVHITPILHLVAPNTVARIKVTVQIFTMEPPRTAVHITPDPHLVAPNMMARTKHLLMEAPMVVPAPDMVRPNTMAHIKQLRMEAMMVVPAPNMEAPIIVGRTKKAPAEVTMVVLVLKVPVRRTLTNQTRTGDLLNREASSLEPLSGPALKMQH